MVKTFKANKNLLRIFCVFSLVFVFIFCSCILPVNLSKTKITMEVGESVTISASPSKNVVWTSANTDVATVSEGKIIAVGEGEVAITASNGSSLATCLVTVTPGPLPEVGFNDISLVWRDEFNGDELDLSKWGYQTGIHDVYHGKENRTLYWGNNELQYYTEDSVTVKDGSLIITAERRDYEGMEYTSARILTRDLAYFTFGYFEAKIKLPAIQGMWPAFWMLPQPTDFSSDRNAYGTWAANGELDIMEAKGRLENEIGNALHFGGNYPNNTYLSDVEQLQTSISEWHTYGVDWRADRITWYVDGVASFTLSSDRWWTTASNADSAPFDQPFYLLLNLAVGGNYDGRKEPPEDFTSANMEVDYVRVYKHV